MSDFSEWNFHDEPPDEDELEFEREGFEPAQVKFPMQDHGEVGSHFRNPGDDVNVVRVYNPDPPGCVRVAKNIAVAGVSFRLGEVTAFVFGDGQSLTLVAEPTNKYDKNAIMVMGSHQDSDGKWHEEHVGYVPKKLAAKVKADELIVNLVTMFVPFQGKSPGIRMDLWKKDDLFTLPEAVDLSDYIPDNEEPVSNIDLAIGIVKNIQLEKLPPPPNRKIAIEKDTPPEPSWHPRDGYFGEEPF